MQVILNFHRSHFRFHVRQVRPKWHALLFSSYSCQVCSLSFKCFIFLFKMFLIFYRGVKCLYHLNHGHHHWDMLWELNLSASSFFVLSSFELIILWVMSGTISWSSSSLVKSSALRTVVTFSSHFFRSDRRILLTNWTFEISLPRAWGNLWC